LRGKAIGIPQKSSVDRRGIFILLCVRVDANCSMLNLYRFCCQPFAGFMKRAGFDGLASGGASHPFLLRLIAARFIRTFET